MLNHAVADDDHDTAAAYNDEDNELDENDQCLFPAWLVRCLGKEILGRGKALHCSETDIH